MVDYDTTHRLFSWEAERSHLAGLPDGAGLNIAHEAVDRHATGELKNSVAIRWIRKDGAVKDFTYHSLYKLSNRFANVLTELGIKKGATVFTLAGRIPELYVSALGTLKTGAVFCPLFSVFGPEPIFQRLSRGEAKILVTTTELFASKIQQLLERLPSLEYVLLTNADSHIDNKVLSLPLLMERASDDFTRGGAPPPPPPPPHPRE